MSTLKQHLSEVQKQLYPPFQANFYEEPKLTLSECPLLESWKENRKELLADERDSLLDELARFTCLESSEEQQ